MSEELYNLEFEGKIIPGWELDEVKANLANLMKANEEKITQLFSGRRFFIKKNVDHPTAIKINNALKDVGADCIMTPIPGSAPAAPPPLPSQTQPNPAAQPPAAAAKPALAPADIRPTRFWYVVAVLLFLVPMIASGVSICETDISINKPGNYAIFYETSMFSLANVVNYQIGRDFGITLMDLATGEDLELQPPLSYGTEEFGTTIRQAIAEVQINSVGFYTATVAGEIAAGDRLIVRRFDLVELGKSMAWALGLFFLGFIAGPIMALVVLVKRQHYKQLHRDEPISENEERQWAMFAHIGTFSSIVVPLGNFIAPIVVWQLKKHDSDYVVEQAKEALNFQISLVIYTLLCLPLCFIVIGFFLIFALVIFGLITVIVAGVKANDGEDYQYPMCIRLFK